MSCVCCAKRPSLLYLLYLCALPVYCSKFVWYVERSSYGRRSAVANEYDVMISTLCVVLFKEDFYGLFTLNIVFSEGLLCGPDWE